MKNLIIFMLLAFAFTAVQAQTVIKEKSLYPQNLSKSLTEAPANKFTELSFAIFSFTQVAFVGENYQLSPVSGVWGLVQSWGIENATLKTTNAYIGIGAGSALVPFNFNNNGLETGKTPLTGNLIFGYQIFSSTIGYDFLNKNVVLGIGVKVSFINTIKHKVL